MLGDEVSLSDIKSQGCVRLIDLDHTWRHILTVERVALVVLCLQQKLAYAVFVLHDCVS